MRTIKNWTWKWNFAVIMAILDSSYFPWKEVSRVVDIPFEPEHNVSIDTAVRFKYMERPHLMPAQHVDSTMAALNHWTYLLSKKTHLTVSQINGTMWEWADDTARPFKDTHWPHMTWYQKVAYNRQKRKYKLK